MHSCSTSRTAPDASRRSRKKPHRYIELAQARREASAFREETLRIACTAILASGLSYFLGSSMPDEK
jgi:hypothetical protein